ncbi:DUF4199 domain-containing protein [Aquimarina sp. MMG016]|uniref:DUF4199 domain-containing protein n=1 Tax=Aquimarina sp. MMG016 TaxID=2822690 RepID=UPI001B3A4B88|nr:DUF4199 domain-containing protein [Aquimarina sp. MMG016]MBQ4821804.1 DUF4199 domain-containing protein [Aquimarina sp. MMG016]
MENTASSKKHIINYGLLLGILSVGLGVVIYVTNSYTEQNWVHSLIGFVILIGTIMYGLTAFKKANEGYITLGEALKIGVGISLIGGIVGVIWTILLMNVIEPDMVNQITEAQRTQMIERFPDMPEEQLNQSIEMAAKFTSPYIISAFALIGNLFFGFIISLIGGLIIQKKKDLF